MEYSWTSKKSLITAAAAQLITTLSILKIITKEKQLWQIPMVVVKMLPMVEGKWEINYINSSRQQLLECKVVPVEEL